MIYYISGKASLTATAIFVGLGIDVCRRSTRNAEVKVLLFILALFSFQSMLLFIDALIFGIVGIMPKQSHAHLSAAEYRLQLFALGAVFQSVFLTYNRALDESGLLADPFSQLQHYQGQYWFWVCVTYSLPIAGMSKYAYLVFRTRQVHLSGGLAFPPTPFANCLAG